MRCFSVGQKWVARYGIFGTFLGEVIEISGEGEYGVVVVTDECGNEVHEYTGNASDFQSSGEWQLVDYDWSSRR